MGYDPQVKGYRKSSHTTYQLNYHFVFITKYRKPALRGDVAVRLRDLITQEICARNQIEILKGHVRPEHVHLLLSVPPNLSPSRVMQLIKGKTSNRLMRDFRRMRKEFWGRHLWARGYFVVTTGNVTDEVIAKYIELQGAVPQDAILSRSVSSETRQGQADFSRRREPIAFRRWSARAQFSCQISVRFPALG